MGNARRVMEVLGAAIREWGIQPQRPPTRSRISNNYNLEPISKIADHAQGPR